MPTSPQLCQGAEKRKAAHSHAPPVAVPANSRCRLLCLSRHDIDAATCLIKQDCSIAQGKQRVIVAHANISARPPFGATLPSENVSCDDGFATELLDTAALGFGIPTVAAGTLSLL
jgi:hypothetical protein